MSDLGFKRISKIGYKAGLAAGVVGSIILFSGSYATI
jgi:hypothetical protein